MNLIVYIPLALYTFVIASETFVNTAPDFVKGYLQKGVQNKMKLLELKTDLEIYIGIYLIVGWFLNLSTIISIIVYWQFLRIKYVINYNTQMAFAKFKTSVDKYAYAQATPSILRTAWEKVKSGAAYMASMDQPPQDGQAPPSMCTIF